MFCFAMAGKQLYPKGIKTRTHTVISSLPSPLEKCIGTLEGIGRKQQEERTAGYIWFCLGWCNILQNAFVAQTFRFVYKQ